MPASGQPESPNPLNLRATRHVDFQKSYEYKCAGVLLLMIPVLLKKGELLFRNPEVSDFF